MSDPASGWPKSMGFALCWGCNKDATQTRITYYCVDAINNGPYRCDECRTIEARGLETKEQSK
jgi:hypothetical protein